LLDKQRSSQLAEMRVTTIRDENGAPKSWLKIITDISERKRLEEQLLRAQRLESLGMLAAGIAHDLNNALAPMLMAGGLLRSRLHDPSDLRLVTLLEQSAERGAAMVKQIVSFAGGRDRQRVLLQVKHVVRDVLQLLQDTFPKSIRIEHDLPNSIWAVRGDPTQLHQVLLNLSINARDAMPEGGTLSLSVRNEVVTAATAQTHPGATPGRFVLIELRDSGSGIPAELIEQIWQPFFTTKSAGRGTGLGLSTVRGIVANHGGFLTVESASGRGATFRVYLPAEADSTDAPISLGGGDQPARRSTGELVLVVDDQTNVRESINAVLTDYGYRLLTAGDGIEVLSKYADRMRDVALVITDLDMPGLNGVTLSQAILHLNPAVRILFISGTGEIIAAKRVKTGANSAFLAKPFTPTALLAKVDGLLHPARD
jgi:two-component system, cell cycle sensor histidine kinase and response regulator CckA